MKLTAGERIGRYEIDSLLGKGGMGEVYLARDTELQRSVALKLLFNKDDQERVRRFRQEARAISKLNHPNILTVHDIGDHENFHFIVTEHVKGETLRQQIARGGLELTAALKIAIQIGTALAAAHAAGIVHRDIKPENVMVLPDGHVKVLDFGLAKLLNYEDSFPHGSQASTLSLIDTHPGLVIGTINYMSPEQLRGQPIDERTDIWSLGVVLYEMVTCHRPFKGESNSDVIAAILERQLTPLAGAQPEVPPQLDEILRRALAKDRTQRFETARELVEELKTALRELSDGVADWSGTGPSPAASRSGSRRPVALQSDSSATKEQQADRTPRSNYAKLLGATAIILLVIGGIAAYLIASRSGRRVSGPAVVRPLTSAKNIVNAVISPDGRFFVYAQFEAGTQSLRIGQIDPLGSNLLIDPAPVNYAGLTFTPDGNAIYYTSFDQKPNTTKGVLFRTGLTLGTSQRILDNIDSAVTFAPDGRRLAFFRSLPEQKTDQLIIANADGTGKERVLAERVLPNSFSAESRAAPSWSPDGNAIVVPARSRDASGDFMTLLRVDVQSGAESLITQQKWSLVGKTWWTKDGSAIFFCAAALGSEQFKIFRLSYPDGELSTVITDLLDYSNISLTDDAKTILAVNAIKNSGVTVTSNESTAKSSSLTTGNYDGISGLDWTPDGEVVYVSRESGNSDLWIKRPEDPAPPRQLTTDPAADEYPSVSPDGQTIVFSSKRGDGEHIWRIDRDGSHAKQLTNGSGERFPRITADGKFVVYAASDTNNTKSVLWKSPLDGGEATKLTEPMSTYPAVSPDGKLIACHTKGDSPEQPMKLGIVPVTGGAISPLFDLVQGSLGLPGLPPALAFSTDNQGIMYVATQYGISNIWEQRLTGGAAKQWSDFTAEHIYNFSWSRDGKRLAYARGALRNDLSLISNF